jgi:hypothetical protein
LHFSLQIQNDPGLIHHHLGPDDQQHGCQQRAKYRFRYLAAQVAAYSVYANDQPDQKAR